MGGYIFPFISIHGCQIRKKSALTELSEDNTSYLIKSNFTRELGKEDVGLAYVIEKYDIRGVLVVII